MGTIRFAVAILTMLLLMNASPSLAQSNPVEDFDISGLPSRPTNFMEQRLFDMIEHHRPGDVRDAAFVQRKLAEYYREKGDLARARVADERARAAERPQQLAQGGSQTQTGGVPGSSSVVGEYVCRSMGSRPCNTQTSLRLGENGVWGWAKYSGEYRVVNGRVTFSGVGGAATWGPAVIGPGTLSFASGQDTVVWQKPSPNVPSLAGIYFCNTAPGGGPCNTKRPIEIRADGRWSWGSDGGSYRIVAGQVQFSGLTSGPGGWGPADIGDGVLIFHDRYGSSEWRKE
jgi:hypothetical protein